MVLTLKARGQEDITTESKHPIRVHAHGHSSGYTCGVVVTTGILLWDVSELRVLVSLAVTHIISWPAAVMRWCVFPERCGTSNRMILGDRRPSVALIALHVCTDKHTHTVGIHCRYSWPVSRSRLYTNHCSLLSTAGGGQRVKAKGTKWEQRCQGKQQDTSKWHWMKEGGKTAAGNERDKRKHNVSGAEQVVQIGEETEAEWDGTYMALCLSKDKNKLSYPYQTYTGIPRWPCYEIPWLFHDWP